MDVTNVYFRHWNVNLNPRGSFQVTVKADAVPISV